MMRFAWINNIIAIGIRASGLIAKFLLIITLVKYFQPIELGLYGLLTALIAYSLFFLGLEYYNHISRTLVPASDEEKVFIIRDQFILYGIIFFLLSPVFAVLFYLHFIPLSICYWFLILVIFEHISNEIMRILIVLARPHLANMVFFMRQGFWVLILLPIFYFVPSSRSFHLILISWILGSVISIIVGSVGLYHLPWKKIGDQPINWQRMKQGLIVSQPFLIIAFCALSLLYLERFFVNFYCGIEAVGIYTFYAGLSVALHNLMNAGVSKVRLAQLLAAHNKNDQPLFQQEALYMLKYTIIFVVIFVLLSIVIIHPFLQLINKSIYESNIIIFYFLLFGAACRSVADVPLYTLYAQHSDKLLLSINLSSFGFMLIGNVFLIPTYGLIGAALSSAGASLILLTYALLSMIKRRLHPLPILQSKY